MLTVGEKYKVEIVDMGQSGEGIGRVEGIAVFVNDAVIGDVCTVEITKVKKNYAFVITERLNMSLQAEARSTNRQNNSQTTGKGAKIK